MSKPISWSPRSKQDYLNLLDYLEIHWSDKVVKRFNNRLLSILELIGERPELYPSSDKNGQVRRCVINKQISLYYRIGKDRIELLTLFDNRQNPAKKKL